jgi:hypothetical protein
MEIQEIKQRLTLAQVLSRYNLKPDKHLRLNCPFHEDKTPSMQVYYKTNPPLARVFGSDAGADLQSVPCLSVVSKHHLRSKKRNDLCCLNPELKQLEVITYK